MDSERTALFAASIASAPFSMLSVDAAASFAANAFAGRLILLAIFPLASTSPFSTVATVAFCFVGTS